MATATIDDQRPPVASPDETVAAIVAQGGRDHTPIRISFVQGGQNASRMPGPLAEFVANGDRRGLLLYLLLFAKATSDPWDAALPAAVWARALDVPMPTTKGAASSISKTWLRLEQRRLVERTRSRRMARVTLFARMVPAPRTRTPVPRGAISNYLMPFGSEAQPRTSGGTILPLTEIAMLLIACSHKARFRLPFELAPTWYGLSADTAARGLHGLETDGLLTIDKTFKAAPLAPAGYTSENRYTLVLPFAHRRDTPVKKS